MPSRSPDIEVSLDMNTRKSRAEHDWNEPNLAGMHDQLKMLVQFRLRHFGERRFT